MILCLQAFVVSLQGRASHRCELRICLWRWRSVREAIVDEASIVRCTDGRRSRLLLLYLFARHIHLFQRTRRQASTILYLLIIVGEGAFQHNYQRVEGGMDAYLASWIFPRVHIRDHSRYIACRWGSSFKNIVAGFEVKVWFDDVLSKVVGDSTFVWGESNTAWRESTFLQPYNHLCKPIGNTLSLPWDG